MVHLLPFARPALPCSVLIEVYLSSSHQPLHVDAADCYETFAPLASPVSFLEAIDVMLHYTTG